jgi:hypothetical protein
MISLIKNLKYKSKIFASNKKYTDKKYFKCLLFMSDLHHKLAFELKRNNISIALKKEIIFKYYVKLTFNKYI